VDFTKWNSNDVQFWLNTIHHGDGTTFGQQFGNQFKANDVDGKMLSEASDMLLLRDLNVHSHSKRKKLLEEIDLLRVCRFCQKLDEHYVMKKLDNNYSSQMKAMNFKLEMAEPFFNPDKMRRVYLDLNKNLLNEATMKQYADDLDGAKNPVRSAHILNNVNAGCDFPRKPGLKIKLVLTNFSITSKDRPLKHLLSPVSNYISLDEKDSIRTGLLIGPWYVEWNTSELIVPKRLCNELNLLYWDVIPLQTITDNIDSILDKLCELFVRWNVQHTWSATQNEKQPSKEKTCHEFVDAVLETLGITILFGPTVESYLETIRENGSAPLVFKPAKPLQSKYGLEKQYTFETHKQLDKFLIQLKSQSFHTDNQYEWMVLTAFDRAFWLRHIVDVTDDKYQPFEFDFTQLNFQFGFKNSCPFVQKGRFYPGCGDPQLSLLDTAFGNLYY
jgi:hypothetical protein